MAKLGLVSGTVRIEEYTPEWADEYIHEEKLLREHLREFVVDIQHVGSTSIVGCCAKPIIDIAIGVESLEYGEKLIPVLCSIGYVYSGDGGIPGRHFFKKQDGRLSTHYIHVEPISGTLWSHHIQFRDYLISHPILVKEYSDLKKRLESVYYDNRDNYALGKNPFIENVLRVAEQNNQPPN